MSCSYGINIGNALYNETLNPGTVDGQTGLLFRVMNKTRII